MVKFNEMRPSYSTCKDPRVVDNDKMSIKDGHTPKMRCKQCYFFNDWNRASCAACGSFEWK